MFSFIEKRVQEVSIISSVIICFISLTFFNEHQPFLFLNAFRESVLGNI